ncbi:MAG: hypothetical protein DHS20C01_22730 [marine bacterium B5-7]|nr:MAG: hypothetical protein DHS20C01_22730 [marine bacterium B5-7]
MSFKVHIKPGNREMEIHSHESFLEAALNAALPVNYGCSNGNCGKCQAQLISGEIAQLHHSDFVFPVAEKSAGGFLMCCTTAASDCEIETRLASGSNEIEQQDIVVKVRALESLNEDLMLLKVQTPRTRRLRFLAGQSAQLSLGDDSCTLPIASCPCDDRNLQFHVPSDSKRCRTSEVLRKLRPGAMLNLKGPSGDFVLDADSNRPRIMIGTGLGLAPIKSIIEHSLALAPDCLVTLLLMETADRPYPLNNIFRSWRDAFDSFDCQWLSVETDNLFDAITNPLDDILTSIEGDSESDIYVAGPHALIDTVTEVLTHRSIDLMHLRTGLFDELIQLRQV